MPEKFRVVLGFDFGTKRIGVAVGQALTQTATPLPVLKAQHGQPDWELVKKLIAEWRPQMLVVGLPLHMSGDQLDVTPQAHKFANRLHGRFGLPVVEVDERLSSYAAEALMEDAEHLHPGAQLDSMAAKVILETWLQQANNAND